MQNVVITRFSLRMKSWKRRLFYDEHARESWFAFRAELYKKTLGASLAAQEVKPVRVYLLMDTGDRELQQRYLPSIGFTPLFTSAAESAEKLGADLVREGLVDNIALTRIDSDDIIERAYFRKLNTTLESFASNGDDSGLVITCRGYRSNFSVIQPLYHSIAPFVTLFHKRYTREASYFFNHNEVEKIPHVKDSSAEWMQVIHGTNVANGFKPVTAESLEAYLDGTRGSASLPLRAIDPEWFRQWSGFDLPSPDVFQMAPMSSLRSRIRKFWRGVRGKI